MADGGGGDAQFLQVIEAADPGTIAADSGVIEDHRGSMQLRGEIGGIDAAVRGVDHHRTGGFRTDAGDAVAMTIGARDIDRSPLYTARAGPFASSISRIPAMMR